MPPLTASPRHTLTPWASPCRRHRACTRPLACSHLPAPLLQGPTSPLALQAHRYPVRRHHSQCSPITATPRHLRTAPRRLAKAPRCKRKRSPSRRIISTTRLPDILRIGRPTTPGLLAIRPRRRRALRRRLSAPARQRPALSPTSRRGMRARIIAWGHRRGVMNTPPVHCCSFTSVRTNYTAVYCTSVDFVLSHFFFFLSSPPYALFICCSLSVSFGSPQYASLSS
jgi:hypothetical protein